MPPKIALPKPEPKPEVKPIQMEAKLTAPMIKSAKPQVVLSPQPKAVFGAPCRRRTRTSSFPTKQVHSWRHLRRDAQPECRGRATVAAIGNPYAACRARRWRRMALSAQRALATGNRVGSSAGVVGKVASAGVPHATNTTAASHGHVASAGIPTGPSAPTQAASNFHERPSDQPGGTFQAAGAVHL